MQKIGQPNFSDLRAAFYVWKNRPNSSFQHDLFLRIYQQGSRKSMYQRAQLGVGPCENCDPKVSYAIDAALSSREDQTNTHASI